jgi:hypothetical protein
VQRLRDLVAANPTRRLAGAKADAKSFFRQFPIWQRDWGFMGHRWLGVLIIHIVLSFGLRSAVHVSCTMSNAISDVLQSVAGVWCAFFVDDAILLNYESAIGRDSQWLLGIGSALGLVWNAAKCVKQTSLGTRGAGRHVQPAHQACVAGSGKAGHAIGGG